jgi:hypothetical protein
MVAYDEQKAQEIHGNPENYSERNHCYIQGSYLGKTRITFNVASFS